MKPPALPIAPKEYSSEHANTVYRILTQHLFDNAHEVAQAVQKVNNDEVLLWLS